MQVDWTAVLVALLGSNLILEIYRSIRDNIRKRRKLDVESELNSIKETLNATTKTMNETMKSIKDKLETDFNRLNLIEKQLIVMSEVINRNSKGTILSLENDTIVFNAFRHNHINGESEIQEKKLEAYYKECAESNLQIH